MRKILIIAPAWVGDMVMSQTLLKLLKVKYPDCQIDVLVSAWAKDVAKRMPEINNVLINPFKHGELGLWQRIKLGMKLRKENYVQCFILPNSLKSAIIPFFAGITLRSGFIGEMRYGLINDIYKLDKVALPLMIDRFCALANNGLKLSLIKYPEFLVDKLNQTSLLAKFRLNLQNPVICLCPAAEYGLAKRWPSDYFAKLADLLQTNGYQVWILGSNKDQDISNSIIHSASIKHNLYDLCGKTNLIDVIDLLSCAKSVISNDSGLMHIACAVNVPVVAIYGSSSPSFTPPLSNRAKVIQVNTECSPCFERTCKFGHYNCLRNITPEVVLHAVENQIDK